MAVGVRVPVVETGIAINPRLLTAQTSCAPPEPDPQAPVKTVALLASGALAVTLTAVVWAVHGPRFGVYLTLGLLLGLALYHSRFGFTTGWRQLVAVGNGQNIRAQSVMFGTAATVIALVSATGVGLFGATPRPVPTPLGLALVGGAVLFAVGMQLAGSCASGTLFAVGTGQSTILPTLAAFIAGAVFYTWAYPVLGHLPRANGILLSDHVGWLGSWAVTITLLLAIVVVTWLVQRRRNPPPLAPAPTAHGFARLYRGSWPMLTGAIVIGVLAGGVFLVSGGVWGVMNAFSLWGAKFLQLSGLHPETWEYWRVSPQAPSLASPVLTDRTSLTDFGIMIGAAMAAAAAGAWTLHTRLSRRALLAAVIGGFLMGVGSRMAEGCNIGAYLGGVSIGSVSGWVWGLCALGGTWLGVRLRPLFGLTNPKPDNGIC